MLGNKISKCRVCGNARLLPVLEMPEQELSGIFPLPGTSIPKGPLNLVRCEYKSDGSTCGLVQLDTSYPLDQMYGDNYGYRSSLNPSMKTHLNGLYEWAIAHIKSKGSREDTASILDIGSNDGTFLSFFKPGQRRLIGVDPTIHKFEKYYRQDIERIQDFFPSEQLVKSLAGTKLGFVSSIAMFYDLDDPVYFAKSIKSVLNGDGYWLFEQSYLPDMLANTSYDTICHEHLEFYSLTVIRWILRKAGMRVSALRRSGSNGGSLAVLATPAENIGNNDCADALALQEMEDKLSLLSDSPYIEFSMKVKKHREDLLKVINNLISNGNKIWGYGASTKGNIMLKYCGLGPNEIAGILEVNQDKFGHVTPGTEIPIVDEKSVELGPKDVLLVLPWHFRDFFIKKLDPLRKKGVRILFPLPIIEII